MADEKIKGSKDDLVTGLLAALASGGNQQVAAAAVKLFARSNPKYAPYAEVIELGLAKVLRDAEAGTGLFAVIRRWMGR